jgi:[acyl-carrier-protein] S-malonyltransferase
MLSVIGLGMDALKTIAEKAGVEIANLNSPEQTVLSGLKTGVQLAEKLAGEAGAKRAIVLNVAGGYHSSLMATAARKLEEFLRSVTVHPTRIPVISNVTGLPHGAPEDIKREMVRQVSSSVQWVTSVQWLQRQGVRRYVECGPGRVLSGLVKRIHAGAELLNVQDCPSLEKTLAALAPE